MLSETNGIGSKYQLGFSDELHQLDVDVIFYEHPRE